MNVLFRLSLRNLTEHKAKTIIISLFIIVGSAIVILGNSFLESMNRGLEKDFRANYTGDITISANVPKEWNMDIFGTFPITSMGELPAVPALMDIDRIQSIVEEYPQVKETTKMISAKVLILKGIEADFSAMMDDDSVNLFDTPISMLYAGEKDTYFNMFGDFKIVEGRMIDYDSDEEELILDLRLKEKVRKFFKEEINLGDTILVAGASTKGIVREGKIVGFFTPPNEHSAMIQIAYSTPHFARAFGELTYAADFGGSLSSDFENLSSDADDDALFGDDDLFGDMIDEDSSTVLSSEQVDFSSLLGDTSLRNKLNEANDKSWHFLQAKVHNPWEADSIVKKLNARFKEEGIDAQAMNWRNAAKNMTNSMKGVNIFFNIVMIILAISVFIIIMNTMVVSVIERTGEIGTMRAIGTDKSFVRLLFHMEATMLTLASSLIGSILAIIIASIVNSMNFKITNAIAKMILGGGLVHFSITPLIIILTNLIAFLGSLLSNLYPVSSALKITPLKALSKGGE